MKQKPVSSTYIKTFLQCPQKFYYKYHERKDALQTGEARAFGIAVHEALEKAYKRLSGNRRPNNDDYEYTYQVFIDSSIDNGLIDQDLYAEGRQLLKDRLDNFDPKEKVIGLELKFGFRGSDIQVSTSGGTPLIGAIDKIVELDKDTLVVIDYKTSRTALTDNEASKDEQLSLYDLAVSKLFPNYKKVIVALDYLRLSPVITHRTPKQRKQFEEFVDRVYDKIGKMKEEDVKPSLNEFCGWCDYKSFCPKYCEYVSSPDLLLKPLGSMSDADFVREWEKVSNIKRAVDSYQRDLKMHAANISQGDRKTKIIGDEKVLSQTQVSRVYYDAKTILDVIPKKDCSNLITVKKKAVDNYISDRPEYADAVSKTMQVTYQSPFFRIRKKTSKDGD